MGGPRTANARVIKARANTANHTWYEYTEMRSMTPIQGVTRPSTIRSEYVPAHPPNPSITKTVAAE